MIGKTNGVETSKITFLNQCDEKDERLKELQGRTKRCCCAYCGGELVLRRITIGKEDSGRIEIFCPNCDRIEFGVEKEIYAVADYYVNILNFDYYQDFNDSERKRRMNRAKACEIMQWGCKNLGLLKDDGFAVKLEIDIALLSKDMILTEDGLVQQIKAKEELS